MKRKTKNGEIHENILHVFIEPLQKELDKYNINILQVHDMVQDRHVLVHHYIRSCEEQKDFFELLEDFKFSDKFVYGNLVKDLFHLLKKTTLKRYVN